MNCANHPEAAAVAFCRSCGKPVCPVCQRPSQGTIFCDEHVPVTAEVPGASAPPPPPPPGAQPYASPYTNPYGLSPGDPGASPGLAFLLGLIPGVGAIYNGQYAKGLVHVAVFGLIITIMNSGAAAGLEVLLPFLLAGWYFYMPFEAYHTARRRQRGEPVDEFSSLFPTRTAKGGFPIGPLLLIALGVLFLLNTLELIRFYQIIRWWPVFLIALGVYLLYMRIAGGRPRGIETGEAVDGR